MNRIIAFIVCAAMALSMQPAYFLMTAHAGIQNIVKELQERDKQADEQLRQVEEERRQAEESLGKAEERQKVKESLEREYDFIKQYAHIDYRTLPQHIQNDISKSLIRINDSMRRLAEACKKDKGESEICKEEFRVVVAKLVEAFGGTPTF